MRTAWLLLAVGLAVLPAPGGAAGGGGGGRFALVDIFEGQEQGDLSRAVMKMDFVQHYPELEFCDPRQIQRFLSDAGFDNPLYAHLDAAPYVYGLLVAWRQ